MPTSILEIVILEKQEQYLYSNALVQRYAP